ncbi:hypothetical protein ULMS_23640 [Patiriisocius marinistellae]|uniref:Subtilisin n=2 Tax=Patiriisocius marinistellae TaxID=2494560 RepID=A0A5J4G2D8_9FLAO|nr:hypothetical protein ULMS_23640 [Patiriisocius marinistellae]
MLAQKKNTTQKTQPILEQLISQKGNTHVITSEHVSSVSGIHHVYLRQAINGLGIYGTESSVHLNASGKTLITHNNFLLDAPQSITSSSASISALDAIQSVVNKMGYSNDNLKLLKKDNGVEQKMLFSGGNISERDIPAKLLYYYSKMTGTRIVWELSIKETNGVAWWNFQIDAVTGAILNKENWIVSCNILGNHETHDHSSQEISEEINIETKTISNPTTAENAMVGNYNVYAMPVESPNYGGRTMEANPDNATASPFGWHDTNGANGAEFTITRGNNVHAYEDGDNPGFSPDGGAGLVFNFPLNETYSNADQSEAAAITNLFYWNNIIHDVTYQYGFDEASGNFQQNNYGNGGAGNDYVFAEAQDGSGDCNANMGTPGDGGNPTMQMYTCNNRDGDLDNGVIVHEYAHGISNRLTGGAAAAGCLQNTEQMGEGWSDYYALMLTLEPGDLGPDSRPIGTWLTGVGPTGGSIRTFDYSTDFSINPHTYDDIMTESVPHGVGSVWAAMLWEMTWELIDTHGFDPDIYNGTSGNNISLTLVTEGMKLQPCSPGFVDGRDAILAADQAIYGGANRCEIWEAFARRGLGFSATQGGTNSRSDGSEAFDLPPTFSSFDTIEEVCLADGVQSGLGGGFPVGGVYSGPGVTDDANGMTYTFDPAIPGAGTVTISYATVDFCTGAPGVLTDTIEVTDNPPILICKGSGTLNMTGETSDSPNLIIEDLNTVSTTMNVTDNVNITDLNIELQIAHTYVGDMIITIESPAGTQVTIFNGTNDGCSGNDITTLFDDESINGLSCNTGLNAFPEPNYIPSNALTAFDGENTLGTWTIFIQDTFNEDPGILNYWSLLYDYQIVSTPLDVFLDVTGNATVNAPDFLESISLDCGTFTVTAGTPLATTVSFTNADIGLNNVEVLVTTGTGQTATCTAVANVIPSPGGQSINCPDNITLECGDDTTPANTGMATSLSTCDPNPVVTFSDNEIPGCGNTLVIERTWLSTDNCGSDIVSCVQTITVEDTTAPTLECPMDIVVDTDPMQCTAIVTYSLNEADTCGNVTVSQIQGLPSGSEFPIGTTTNEFIVMDDCGNTTECLFTVTVENNTPPEAICQDITVQLDAAGTITIDAADVNGGSGTICSSVNATIDIDTFDCSNIGPNNVTLTVIDNDGNEASCVAIVTVEDTVIPDVICQNITVQLDETGTATITAADVDGGSFDACGIVSSEIDITTFDCANVGINQITLIVTDENGNINSCIAEVTVEDTISPIAICQEITVQLDAMGMATILPTDVDNGSTDNCTIASYTLNMDTFDCTNIGINEVTLTVIDENGNEASCETLVTVEDTIAPTAICNNITVALDEDGIAIIDVSDIDGGSTDNCTIISTEIDIEQFDCSNIGTNDVTLTVIDQDGNEATCVAIVTVEESAFPPNAVCQNVTVTLMQDGTATVLPSAFDGGSSGIRCFDGLSIDRDSFDCNDIGSSIQIIFTVTNAAGETDSCAAFVNVVDGLAPVVVCPADQTVISNGPYELPDYIAIGDAVATDNCTTPITIYEQDPAPGTLLPQGDHEIEITVQDNGGFEATCSFILTVDDILGTQSPAIARNAVSLFPNPANNRLSISNPQNISIENLSIYDITGRLVQIEHLNKTGAITTFNISALQSATYLVIIETEFGQIIKQLIKE